MRPAWDSYFLQVAAQAATRSTCSRLQVGAVAVRGKRILATGYNGAPEGHPHCDHTEKPEDRCQIAVHAEANVVSQAARYGVPLDGTDVYVTHCPCTGCIRLLKNAGVARIFYKDPYGNLEESYKTADLCSIELQVYPPIVTIPITEHSDRVQAALNEFINTNREVLKDLAKR